MDLSELAARNPDHWRRATAIRALTLDAVAAANSGHSGMPMGMADVATVLFERHLKFSAAHPDWPDRDRFILSAGHGSMLLYSLLYLTGYADMTLDQIRNFRQLGAITAGHPENFLAQGIETTTGPLGQGLANAVGFAIAEEHLRARFGADLIDHRTWVIAGDGCLMEGVSQEALTLAGRQELSRLIVLFDDNGITIDGTVALADCTDQKARFAASGWRVLDCDGHDPADIDRALTEAAEGAGPALVVCRTHIALGSSAQDTSKGHGALTDPDLIAETKSAYGWPYGPFEIPDEVLEAWRATGARGAARQTAWAERLAALPEKRRAEFARVMSGAPAERTHGRIRGLKEQLAESAPKLATRKASEMALEVLNPIYPEMLGGSADLTGSNNTRTGDLDVFSPDNRAGRYIHYGIREHGMAAAMNGIALHGGCRAYGGTFLCFADYMRGALRLSALMGVPVQYVLTHDSIGLGEDGPTHQPVEHLAMLRATPNLLVFRPADGIETAEAWEVALNQTRTPSVLALSRQGVPAVRTVHRGRNMVEAGAYVLADAEATRRVVLMATGTEVSVAMAARDMLEAEGIGARVVSMPCWELFERVDPEERRRILPSGMPRVGVEAAVRHGWDRWLLGEGNRTGKAAFVGMEGFGASAPAPDLYRHFGITAEAVATAARALL